MTLPEEGKQRFQERYGVSIGQAVSNPEIVKNLEETQAPYLDKPYSKNSRPLSPREADRRNLAILARW